MAYLSRITNWTLKNSLFLNLKVKSVSGTSAWFKGVYDFQTTIIIGQKEFFGRGVDQKEERALAKAFSEALERHVATTHGYDSSGIAAHETQKLAERSAKLELYERDSFFCHYLTGKPFVYVAENYDINGTSLFALKSRLFNLGIELNVGVLNSAGNTFCCVAYAFGLRMEKEFGVIVGLGASDVCLEAAIQKATMECMLNVLAVIHGPSKNVIELEEFHKKSSFAVRDHFELALSIGYAKEFRRKFKFLNEGFSNRKVSEEALNIKIQELSLPSNFPEGCPIFFARATSQHLQSAFWGKTEQKKINWDRIRGFVGSNNLELSDLNKLPHPLG